MKLSIGMIVKNEEQTLHRCLKSLQPILNTLDSELIIVDTGSTDKTVDIAKQYTDKVYFFEWNGNFSDARNESVKYSKGEWYMTIDADEWVDDPDELIRFLSLGEDKKYNFAMFRIKNFIGESINAYKTSLIGRLTRNTGKPLFKGAIHEVLEAKEPIKYFDFFINHTGYMLENEQDRQKKHERNLAPLLEEYKKGPSSPEMWMRLLSHMLNEYIINSKLDEAEKYVKEGLLYVKKHFDLGYYAVFYTFWVKIESKRENSNKIVEIINEYFAGKKQDCSSDADNSIRLAQAYTDIKDFEKADETLNKYFRILNMYEKGTLCMDDVYLNNESVYLKKEHVLEVYCEQADIKLILGKPMEALECLENISVDEIGLISDYKTQYFTVFFDIINKTEDFEYLISFYQRLMDENENISRPIADILKKGIALMEDENVAKAFVEAYPEPCDAFVTLMHIKYYYLENPKHACALMDSFFSLFAKDCGVWDDIFSIAVKIEYNLSDKMESFEFENIQKYAMRLSRKNKDFSNDIIKYMERYPDIEQSQVFCYIAASIIENRLIEWDKVISYNETDIDIAKEYLFLFSKLTLQYSKSLYLETALNEETEQLLPISVRFAHEFKKAQDLLDSGDELEYIRTIRQCVKIYPEMVSPIKLLIKEHEQLKKVEKKIRFNKIQSLQPMLQLLSKTSGT